MKLQKLIAFLFKMLSAYYASLVFSFFIYFLKNISSKLWEDILSQNLNPYFVINIYLLILYIIYLFYPLDSSVNLYKRIIIVYLYKIYNNITHNIKISPLV